MIESWRKVWRDAVGPLMSVEALTALEAALRTDDCRLIQGATTTPPPMMTVKDCPVAGACALGYCGWVELEIGLNKEPESIKPEGSMEIILTKDKVAWVDAADYHALSCFKWWAWEHHGRWYASRTEYIGGKDYEQLNILMHRQLMVAPANRAIDHIDHNGLNNTRKNLRIVTDAENKRNCRRSGRSIFRGVYPSSTQGKWCAKLSVNNKSVYLGTFTTEREAACARNDAALKEFGDIVVLNKFATVSEIDEFFARLCFAIDERLGEPSGCRWFLNWYDETPRDVMRRELLAEVKLSLNSRVAA